jgi:signal transduction histidine kinase
MQIKPDTLLIVDDKPENISVLFHFLVNQGFKILIAENGEDGLVNAEEEQPDLILLDVMMPNLDGFETCMRLKKNPKTQDIPVIFMTALSGPVEKVKAFELGAVDYVTKPFQQEEVLARIKTHLTLRKLQQELEAKNEDLIKLNQEKNEFLDIVAHDLRNPLSAIYTAADFMKNKNPDAGSKINEMAGYILDASKQTLNLIENFLNIKVIESGKEDIEFEVVNLMMILQWMVNHYTVIAQKKNITVHFDSEDKQYLAWVNETRVTQVLENLISNAIKYSPHGKQINIRLSELQCCIRCEVQDQGAGLSESDKKQLFGKFARLSARPTGQESSVGLGLFIVKKLVEMMNGKIWCESELGQGSTFIVEFPIADK